MARTRSTRAHQKVLEAALNLFAERGIDATSMDAIADAAGVSKATIYKHWPDKEALCLEVVSSLNNQMPAYDSGDLRADMIAVLEYQPDVKTSSLRERLIPHFRAYAALNPAFWIAWRSRILEPPRTQLTRMLKHGVAQRRLRPDLDIEVSMALLIGPMMYRHFMNSGKPVLPDDMAKSVVDAFLKAHAKEPRSVGRQGKTRNQS